MESAELGAGRRCERRPDGSRQWGSIMSTTNQPVFTVTCPNCGKETEKSLAWLEEDGHFSCAGCGNSMQFDGPAILKEMQADFSEGKAKLAGEIARNNRLLKG